MVRARWHAASLLLVVLSAGRSLAQAAPLDSLPRRIQLGATLAPIPDSARRPGVTSGAFILGVIASSPAADAGLRAGDILTRIGADSVRDVPGALAALRPIRAGTRVPIVYRRAGVERRATFLARERPRETASDLAIEYRAVAAAGGRHRVLVTHPTDGARHPAVLLLGGIGCYAVDAPAGTNSYRDLTYDLARRGYTTVRVEKLGVGDSDRDDCLATDFETELDGYRAALDAMATYPSVDPSRIFLLGHSIGGIEAPLLASRDGVPRVRGVAVLSTVGIAWYEYELANLRRQLRLQGMAPDSLEHEMRLKTTCTYELLLARESRAAITAREPSCAAFIAYPASDAYMQQVAARDPASAWKRVNAPALVMYAGSDFITSRDEHLALVAAIDAMHPGAATFAEIAELDHYLSRQPSQDASMRDPIGGLARPYYGATLIPVLAAWLDRQSA